MHFSLQVVFHDDKTLNLTLDKDQLKALLECLENGKAYWASDASGVFIRQEQVKYALFGEMQDEENKDSKEDKTKE